MGPYQGPSESALASPRRGIKSPAAVFITLGAAPCRPAVVLYQWEETNMLVRSLFAAALVLGLQAVPALAFQCPKDMGKIDTALAKSPQLSADQLAEVKTLRAEGATKHKAGTHQGAVDALAKAMAILGIM